MGTLAILNDIADLLQEANSELDVVISAAAPIKYIPPDKKVAVLLQYGGSDFTLLESTDVIVLERTLQITATVIVHNVSDAINALDSVRDKLGGILPPRCERPLLPKCEKYISV